MINVWVARDSTNQPVRNSTGPACSTPSIKPKVRKSNSELIGPNVSMNLRMKAMFQCDGACSWSASTRSAGIASCELSYSRLLSRIWLGSIGRKVSTADAAAALNMLPKLLDVPISTYLMVLAKMRRPSATPVASTPRSFSNSTTSAASFATSAAVSTEMPTSAACRASASLTPSPRKPTDRPVRRSETIRRAFCSGEIRAKIVWFCAAASNAASSSTSISAPVIVPLDIKPKSAQTFSATCGLSPVATLTSIPRAASWASESRAAAFGSSANTRKPSNVSPHSSSTVMAVRSGAGLLATATTRRPSANSASSVRCATCSPGSHRALRHHLLGCTLDYQQAVIAVVEQRGCRSAGVVERQHGDPVDSVGHQARGVRGLPQCGVHRVGAQAPRRRIAVGGQQPGPQHRICMRTSWVDGVDQADPALGQRSGLIGDQDVDVSEVLDTYQPFDQNVELGQPPRSGR